MAIDKRSLRRPLYSPETSTLDEIPLAGYTYSCFI